MTERLPRRRVEANGITFAVVDQGEGPPVLLLHGFPDSADLWRHQIPVLVEAGYRVIAPDLRGFGESDRPQDVAAYDIPVVLGDLRELMGALGLERARLVTHDWGAVAGWLFAASHEPMVDRLVALSVGYQARRPTLEELEKYWYIFLFQFEGVAEEALRRDDWRLMREWLREGMPGASPDVEMSLADLDRPGALTAGLNWYRAIATPEAIVGGDLPLPPVTCPVLAVWGEHDILPEARITVSRELVTGPWRYERFQGVGHWIPTEAPDRLNALLLEFLAD